MKGSTVSLKKPFSAPTTIVAVVLLLGMLMYTPAQAQQVIGGSNAWSTCAVDANGNLYTWGIDDYLHPVVSSHASAQDVSPVQVAFPAGVTSWKSAAIGGYFTLALGNDGNVYAWGLNTSGQLGDGTTTNDSALVKVDLPVTATAVAAGNTFGLAIGSDGNVYAWGTNSTGLGDGTTTSSTTPVKVSLPTGITATAIGAGQTYALAIGSDGKVYGWGSNGSGQFGDSTKTNSSTPVAAHLPTGVTATAISAGASFTLAIGSDGKIYAWGGNGSGQLGNGTTGSASSTTLPVVASMPSGVTGKVISAGRTSSLALGSDGKVYQWGDNLYGEEGDGKVNSPATVDTPTVVSLPGSMTATNAAATYYSDFAVASNSNIFAWGFNQAGELGIGTTTGGSYGIATPTLVVGVGGTGDLSLPVQMTGFTAQSENSSVVLDWQTQSEINNAGFNILRQDPGSSSFKMIASYASDNALKGLGTSTSGRSYTFTDNNVLAGSIYEYEIQSVSTSGTVRNSNQISVTVDLPKHFALSDNYPNPFNPSTVVKVTLSKAGLTSLKIYNVLGQLVKIVDQGYKAAGDYTYDINMNNLASGVYFYTLQQGTNIMTKKMLLLK